MERSCHSIGYRPARLGTLVDVAHLLDSAGGSGILVHEVLERRTAEDVAAGGRPTGGGGTVQPELAPVGDGVRAVSGGDPAVAGLGHEHAEHEQADDRVGAGARTGAGGSRRW